MCNTNQPPVNLAKVGFDCTIPRVGGFDRLSFAACHVTDPFALPQGGPTALTEEDVTRNMEAFIRGAPRSWFDILSHFSGQPYPIVYRAFGSLRHRLGRMSDERPAYPYIFADSCFVDGKGGTS
jgi:4-hydroxy-3-polyprenylbenzoate decarboxylase